MTALRALALSSTPKKPHTQADPPPADRADEQAPAQAPPAQAGTVGAQEPAPAASLPKAGGKLERRSPRARQWQIILVLFRSLLDQFVSSFDRANGLSIFQFDAV